MSNDEITNRMIGKLNSSNHWRTQPMYSYREVSELAHVSVSTVRNWLHGYDSDNGRVSPLFRQHNNEEKSCSFLELIEIVVAANFRKAEHVPFALVKQTHDNAEKLYNLQYPFARMELKAIGGHIVRVLRVRGASLQAVDVPEQYTIPDIVQQIIDDQLDFEFELASRWYPVGKKVPIIVDPRISAGLPVVQGRGVTVDTIFKRFKADQSMAAIARDYQIERNTIEKVIQFREKIGV
jgi:uncharacterized protein (DUF433 family)